MKKTNFTKALVVLFLFTGITFSQLSIGELKLKSSDNSGLNLSSLDKNSAGGKTKLMQKPTKKIYFVPGGKIGMFFLQGDFNGNQLISLEAFGKYVGDGFWAEISIPFRFKTSPAFTDIGLDVNVMYPFLGSSNKSEVDPFVGGGLGLHFIGRDRDDPNKTSVAARGGLGLNLIAGAVFFRNYDFNIVLELKYFNYLREFDDLRYQGIGLNVGVTFPR
ncbi:MAG: hypothetical protein J0M37_07600 [Ignavibacteria bacterium]|nr:hypothetical protein [Ignavibacteria bacterium]